MKDAARARRRHSATRGGPRAITHSTLHNPKKGRLAVLLEQRRHRRRLGHDLLDAPGDALSREATQFKCPPASRPRSVVS